MKLTPKQKAFADEYLICGNVTEAAKKAGYSGKTAAVIGNENLKKPNVLEYIAERQKQIDDSRIADVKEVMQFYSAVLRGEVKDQFDMDAALSRKNRENILTMQIIAGTSNRERQEAERLILIIL